jgi:hypothetical protein
VSLCKTVVSGRRHASKALGICGSIHWNSALANNAELLLDKMKKMKIVFVGGNGRSGVSGTEEMSHEQANDGTATDEHSNGLLDNGFVTVQRKIR